jgi:hypothetical protein
MLGLDDKLESSRTIITLMHSIIAKKLNEFSQVE